ncbi:MAG: hypothetical protein H0X67_15685 [Acidobacteria bacterium]|nr:hypothetical protein [Acidobacteriota bacterium]
MKDGRGRPAGPPPLLLESLATIGVRELEVEQHAPVPARVRRSRWIAVPSERPCPAPATGEGAWSRLQSAAADPAAAAKACEEGPLYRRPSEPQRWSVADAMRLLSEADYSLGRLAGAAGRLSPTHT